MYGAKDEIAAICTSFVFGDAPTCDAREPRDVKFAGRMIIQNFVPVAAVRLGSVVANPTQGSVWSALPKYYAPFGEQYNEAVSGTVFPGNTNFATYFHEETTGLNYASQRFYNATYGRFMNADPYKASAGPEDPGSWNKYAYTRGSPAQFIDPTGTSDCDPNRLRFVTIECSVDVGGGGNKCGIIQGFLMGDPFCFYGPDPNPPPPPPTKKDPECFAQLKGRPVDDPAAAKVSALHTFWYVQNASGQQYIVSGGPSEDGKRLEASVTPGRTNGTDLLTLAGC